METGADRPAAARAAGWTHDLIVVGAGPAGCAAALRALAVRPHLRVLLVDRAAFPRDKVCGDGIGPRSVALLEALDAAHVLAGGRWFTRLRLSGPLGAATSGAVAAPGVVLPRAVLDARLLEVTRDRGVEFRQQRVTRVEVTEHGVALDGGLQAPVVIGADGANSAVRRALTATSPSRRHTAVAIRAYADLPAAPSELCFHFPPQPWPAYLWCFPGPGGRANVGLVALDGRDQLGRERFLRALEATLVGTVLPSVDRIDPDTIRGHRLPLSTARQRVTWGPVLLAGDAASLVNPLSGEGIATALLSGALAGAAAVQGPARAGAVYRAALQRELGGHLRHSRWAARLLASPAITASALRAADEQPRVFGDLVDLSVGTGQLTVATAVRIGVRHHRRRVVPGDRPNAPTGRGGGGLPG